MRILVTGGAGFIGSNFIRYMLGKYPDYQLINFDKLTYAGNLMSLNDIEGNPSYTFVKGDITNPDDVDAVFQGGLDIVVNFAAESHVDRSITDPGVFVQTNIVGTRVLLSAAVKHNVQKFVQVSTDEVYGTLEKEGYFTEDTPLSPNSPYSASKAGADLFVRAFHETYGLQINITRCSNNYGPFQFPEKLIPLMIIHALEDKPLPLYGNGLQIRDWLHVSDHCAAIDLVIHKGVSGETYNIGGHNERTNLAVVKTILQYLGKPEDLIRHVDDRPGHDFRYAMDSTKIAQQLGWQPCYRFEEGVRETIQWYVDNRTWWSTVQSGAYMKFYGGVM